MSRRPGPSLRRAISFQQFLREFRELWARVPAAVRGRSYGVGLSAKLEALNRRNPRRFAEVDVSRRSFYFAPQVLLLPRPQRLGVIAHEIGHVLAGSRPHTERHADLAAWAGLDVAILYDRRWPGKGLQTGRDMQPSRRWSGRRSR